MAEHDNAFGKIIAKAWRDPAFKAALIANPAAALKAEGIDVPAGITVTVLENTDKQFHLVLPHQPTGELSDEALEAVAGGRQPQPGGALDEIVGSGSNSNGVLISWYLIPGVKGTQTNV